jgi:hypothetical protein
MFRITRNVSNLTGGILPETPCARRALHEQAYSRARLRTRRFHARRHSQVVPGLQEDAAAKVAVLVLDA